MRPLRPIRLHADANLSLTCVQLVELLRPTVIVTLDTTTDNPSALHDRRRAVTC